MSFVVVIVFVVCAIATAVFTARSMMKNACPNCWEDHHEAEMIIPIVPGIVWLCPICGKTSRRKELLKTADLEENNVEDIAPKAALPSVADAGPAELNNLPPEF